MHGRTADFSRTRLDLHTVPMQNVGDDNQHSARRAKEFDRAIIFHPDVYVTLMNMQMLIYFSPITSVTYPIFAGSLHFPWLSALSTTTCAELVWFRRGAA